MDRQPPRMLPSLRAVRRAPVYQPMLTAIALLTCCSQLDSRTAAPTDASGGSIAIDPAAASVAVGATLQLTASVRDRAGRPLPTADVTWSSARTGVTTVSRTGLVTGVALGSDTVIAMNQGNEARAVIVVQESVEQSDATFTVNTGVTHPISRFIYGLNFLTDGWGDAPPPPGITLNRLGGNRFTAYNWENNFSNAGNDYRFQNDNFLSESKTAGEAVRARGAGTFARGAGLLVTVPMAGYVAANGLGIPLDTSSDTRASRLAEHFKISRAAKGTPFELSPNTSDGFVYQDEFVNWVERTFARERADPLKPVFYTLDNEPDIWHATHAEIANGLQTYDGFIDTTIVYARAIKNVAPNALVFGPGVATYTGVLTLGRYPTPDPKYPVWQTRPFLDVYLDRLRAAEQQYGKRLVDVLDVHWYPQMGTNGGTIENDYAPQDAAMIRARLQAPRSLWDPTYDEESWVSQTASGPVRLLPRLREQIAAHYPGTKIAITEYFYGRAGDISGGIAQADVLGIFGREGVFAATLWPQANIWAYGGSAARAYMYAFGAFRMFLNYDGAGGRFGDVGVAATTSDRVNFSVYASLDAAGRVVLVLINKKSIAQTARIAVTHPSALRTATAYTMTGGSPNPERQADQAIADGNIVSYSMPPLSVTTLVLAR